LNLDEIIKGCKRKEPAAQKAAFELFAGRMLGVCLRYARNSADAEDILQDAFIKVFEKINQFKNEGSFEGWIRKIVVNTALKKYTLSRYSKELLGEELSEKETVCYANPAVYNHLSEKELLSLINKLPDGYRLIFNLFVIEGYKHEEIATMIGINAGTSRSQLAKARMYLQKQIIELQKIAV
jgi:RNA polymerase sigma-70 factor (ECF subfamily)